MQALRELEEAKREVLHCLRTGQRDSRYPLTISVCCGRHYNTHKALDMVSTTRIRGFYRDKTLKDRPVQRVCVRVSALCSWDGPGHCTDPQSPSGMTVAANEDRLAAAGPGFLIVFSGTLKRGEEWSVAPSRGRSNEKGWCRSVEDQRT
ncbi:hypothetical protein SKAU_G00332700 [Synaphobranchus kaupii]|uniref:Uncharacterized protein n=1 Tax=Synaphobranchus kaupii TaxID=118154 RepID=A0A9Q1IIR2_SYNKA|nr:hypothetical protein SKAU_G00332700 [Synaphobranchus kaupii]